MKWSACFCYDVKHLSLPFLLKIFEHIMLFLNMVQGLQTSGQSTRKNIQESEKNVLLLLSGWKNSIEN
jgi:hypothetical protein